MHVIILKKLSSLASPDVVKTIISGTLYAENFIKMTFPLVLNQFMFTKFSTARLSSKLLFLFSIDSIFTVKCFLSFTKQTILWLFLTPYITVFFACYCYCWIYVLTWWGPTCEHLFFKNRCMATWAVPSSNIAFTQLTHVKSNLFEETWKSSCIFYYFSTRRLSWLLNSFLLGTKYLFIMGTKDRTSAAEVLTYLSIQTE